MDPLIQLETTSLQLITALMLSCLALSPQAQAICQQGCDTDNGNTFLGDNALISDTTGNVNTAIGANALFFNTTGFGNTASGAAALFKNTSGKDNTAIGIKALFENTTGPFNTAVGGNALLSNTTGGFNTAVGDLALESNTIGQSNTAIGFDALVNNTTGFFNTAIGAETLLGNSTGDENTAVGAGALSFNATGSFNTASGNSALSVNETGNNNVANGFFALFTNTTGNSNTAIGTNALYYNTSGANNIALGKSAGANITGNDNIDIGHSGVAGEASTIRIGSNGIHTNTFIAGISGVTVADGVGVVIDARGQLGTLVSSARFKDEIKPMDKASETLFSLKPVSFRYKKELDPNAIPQFGLVAEDVEKVNPDLVARDDQGKAYTVRYDAVNAMLLNEFLKEHRKVQELEAIVAQQQKDFRPVTAEQQRELKSLGARVEEQAARIQKVSAQLELSKSAPQTVAVDR
jgi:Chaperone of endosialidase